MLILAHSTIGLLVGTAVKNPVLSFFLGWLSHYVLDFIPHSDTGYFKARGDNWLRDKKIVAWVIGDGLLSLFLVMTVILKKGWQISLITAYIGSLLPDIIDNSPFWSKTLHQKMPLLNWEYKHIHNYFHHTITNKKLFVWVAIISYAVNLVIVFYLLK